MYEIKTLFCLCAPLEYWLLMYIKKMAALFHFLNVVSSMASLKMCISLISPNYYQPLLLQQQSQFKKFSCGEVEK